MIVWGLQSSNPAGHVSQMKAPERTDGGAQTEGSVLVEVPLQGMPVFSLKVPPA